VRDVQPDDPNAIEVTVNSLEYLGAFCRARLLSSGGGIPILADFSANLMRDMKIEQCKTLIVALPADALRVFPADAARRIAAVAS
jgi:iron(III) transport system ATP-binding protein